MPGSAVERKELLKKLADSEEPDAVAKTTPKRCRHKRAFTAYK